jgi:hypothetical protein
VARCAWDWATDSVALTIFCHGVAKMLPRVSSARALRGEWGGKIPQIRRLIGRMSVCELPQTLDILFFDATTFLRIGEHP